MPKVLVVDDEADMRWLLTGVLRDQGLEVVTAEDGQVALEQITRESPDVVLLDLKMPGLDGIQVLEQAKAVDPHMPVVIITAYGNLPSAVQAMRLGAYDYLTKPFDNDEILFTVRRALEKRELEAARLKAAKVAVILEVARAMDHNIRNPLTIIQGNTQLLARELKDPQAAQKLEAIIEGCDRIIRVSQQLSSIVDPVTKPVPGIGEMLDLDKSEAAGEDPSVHGKDSDRG